MTAEVTVSRRSGVNRAVELQMFADAARGKVDDLADGRDGEYRGADGRDVHPGPPQGVSETMEFVIDVLQELFGKDREEATRIMLKIHLDGRGICGVYSRDVANTKVEQVLMAAQHAGHPLQAVSEPVE